MTLIYSSCAYKFVNSRELTAYLNGQCEAGLMMTLIYVNPEIIERVCY